MRLPRVIGHRGAAGLAPENTLAGFRRAAALGVAWVEFDVRLTADGACVLLHDPRLDRTTNGRGVVRETPLTALAGLDAGAWYGPDYAGERVPELVQTLGLLDGLHLGAVLELKADPGRERELAEAVGTAIRSAWSSGPGNLLISSFSVPCLAAIRDLAPDWPRGLLVRRRLRDALRTADALGCVSLHAAALLLTSRAAAEVKAAGLTLVAYTVNDVRTARRLAGWGVESIISDHPDRLLKGLA